MAELQDGEVYQFLDTNCVMETSEFAGDDDDLKLLVSAEDIDNTRAANLLSGSGKRH